MSRHMLGLDMLCLNIYRLDKHYIARQFQRLNNSESVSDIGHLKHVPSTDFLFENPNPSIGLRNRTRSRYVEEQSVAKLLVTYRTLTGFSGSRAQLGSFSTSAPMLVSSPALVLFTYTLHLDTRFTRMLPWSSIFTFTPCNTPTHYNDRTAEVNHINSTAIFIFLILHLL